MVNIELLDAALVIGTAAATALVLGPLCAAIFILAIAGCAVIHERRLARTRRAVREVRHLMSVRAQDAEDREAAEATGGPRIIGRRDSARTLECAEEPVAA